MARKPSTLRESVPAMRRIYSHLHTEVRAERRLLVLGSVLLLAEVGLRLLEPWPLKYVVDAVVTASGGNVGRQPASIELVLLLAAAGLVLVTFARAGASYLNTLSFALAGTRVLSKVRERTYGHLQRLSMDYHDRARTGDLVTRITSDIGRLKDVLVTAALPLAANVVTMVGMVVVVFFVDWRMALIMVSVMPFFLVSSFRMSRKINVVSRKQRAAEGALASLATESLSSMRVVHSYSLQGELQRKFGGSNAKTLRDGVKARRLSAGLERKTDVLVGISTALVVYYGGTRVVSGAMTPGDLVVFLTYLKAAFKPMRDVAKYTGRIAQAAASGERIVDVLDQRPTVQDTSWARPAPSFRGYVDLADVWLSYEPGHPVLRGVDLKINAGERVAVVGASGAGKSSLAMLLSRLSDPDSGQVLIDGHDLRDLTVESVRSQIAVVLQESVLFAATVRENIAHGRPDATEADIIGAARLAGAHGFITQLPQGYDTVLGERGDTLSGGQRQRIAIARAAIRDAAIVLLDEATSGLDEGTEAEVAAALRRLTQGRTTLVITHDLDAARDCARVVWLDGGRVVDVGSPDDVLGSGRVQLSQESRGVDRAHV